METTPEKAERGSELFNELYDELKKVARAQMNRERTDHTLQPTALVNEAYLRLMPNSGQAPWKDKKHFLYIAADVMRKVLIDSARARSTKKRGGDQIKIELTGNESEDDNSVEDVLSVHEALLKLAKISEEKAQLINLRFFGGLTVEEAAETMEISRTTANKYWNFGRAWLYRELTK